MKELISDTEFAAEFIDRDFIEEAVRLRGKFSHGGQAAGHSLRRAARLRGWLLLRALQLGGANRDVRRTYATREARRANV